MTTVQMMSPQFTLPRCDHSSTSLWFDFFLPWKPKKHFRFGDMVGMFLTWLIFSSVVFFPVPLAFFSGKFFCQNLHWSYTRGQLLGGRWWESFNTGCGEFHPARRPAAQRGRSRTTWTGEYWISRGIGVLHMHKRKRRWKFISVFRFCAALW